MTAELVAALHEWREKNDEGGCYHFDIGHGPYATCEDPGEVVTQRALLEIFTILEKANR